MEFDDKSVDLQNHWARKLVRDEQRHLDSVRLDPHAAIRRSEFECAVCFYLRRGGMIVGHGFTRFECAACHQESEHPNTGVPRLCLKCAQEHKVCRRCGADVELRDRTPVQDDAPLTRLAVLVRDAGLVATFDPERDITLPCFGCGAEESAKLVDLEFVDHNEVSRVVTRPFCEACIEGKACNKVTEREIDQRTIKRLHLKLSQAYREKEQAEPDRFRVGDILKFHPQDKRSRWWMIDAIQPGTADGSDVYNFTPVTRKLVPDLTRRSYSGGEPKGAELARRLVK